MQKNGSRQTKKKTDEPFRVVLAHDGVGRDERVSVNIP
jgi:hypothetical protein